MVELLLVVKDLQFNNVDKFKKDYCMGEFMFFGYDCYKVLSVDVFLELIK